MLLKDRHLKSCCAVCAACPVPGVAYFTAGPVAVLAESYQCKIPSAGPKPGLFSAPNNISGCPVLGASCDMSWPYYFLIVLVTAVSGCENISLNQTFICHHTGVHVQAPAFSSLELILFSTSYPGSRLETQWSTEMVAFIGKKAGGDIPTSCTVINPPLHQGLWVIKNKPKPTAHYSMVWHRYS